MKAGEEQLDVSERNGFVKAWKKDHAIQLDAVLGIVDGHLFCYCSICPHSGLLAENNTGRCSSHEDWKVYVFLGIQCISKW